MMKRFGFQKALLALAPLVAVAAAWALSTDSVEAAPPTEEVAVVAPADVDAEAASELAAAALLGPGSNCTYYSNPSKTVVVGQFGYDCCNNYVAWGMKTKYSTCGGCFICYPPPR